MLQGAADPERVHRRKALPKVIRRGAESPEFIVHNAIRQPFKRGTDYFKSKYLKLKQIFKSLTL